MTMEDRVNKKLQALSGTLRMYGGKLHENLIQSQSAFRQERLNVDIMVESTLLAAKFQGKHARLANVDVFNVPNRQMAAMAKSAQDIPHSHIRWVDYTAVMTDSPAAFAMILWYRRDTIEQLYEAIATLSMMTDKTIIVVRGFTGAFHRSDKHA